MEERCVMCGDIIPEGRQVCYRCEVLAKDSRPILKGVVLYGKRDYQSGKAEDLRKNGKVRTDFTGVRQTEHGT